MSNDRIKSFLRPRILTNDEYTMTLPSSFLYVDIVNHPVIF